MSTGERRSNAALAVLSIVAVLVGCGPAPADDAETNSSTPRATAADAPVVPVAPSALDGVTGELVITRQRDLIDRGLINVMTRNDSGASLLLRDIELVADSFDGQPAAQRTISVRDGRQVAIQVPYGVVDDCDATLPVQAKLTFAYAIDHNPVERVARLELEGTDILDSIRTEQCTTRRFEERVRTHFDGTVIADGTVLTDLVIEPIGTATDMTVGAASGTILVGVLTSAGWAGGAIGSEPVRVALTFVVNRCDPHALAEVTKRFALDLDVSVDGAAPVPVSIDISDVINDLEAVVEQCRATLPDE